MKLLPCPFCGGEPQEDGGMFFEFYGHERQDYSIACKKCRAEVRCDVGEHEGADAPCSCHHDTRKICAEKWNRRAAMLQGADGTLTNEGTIPVTQFKPVADLYGLTSPTGCETSFTFDAVEARDFIDGGWSCQEYVELERFQEAVSGNYPVIPDGWVACSEQMPEVGVKVLCFPVNDEPIHATYNGQVWLQDISWSVSDEPIDNVISCNVTHWMPLPAAPQQEVK